MNIDHAIEMKLTSGLLGLIGIAWAAVMYFPDPSISPIAARMDQTALRIFACIMASQGGMLCVGTLVPHRKLRQGGLIIGAISWFTLLGMYLDLWVLNFNAVLVGLFGFFTFVALLVDVRGKPRAKRDSCAG